MTKLYEAHEPAKPFPCPECGEYLASDTLKCRFCAAEISSDYAGEAARRESLANRLYRKGHYSRHLRRGGGLFALGLVGLLGSYFFIPALFNSNAVWVSDGLLLGGGGDFLYGVWGLLSEARSARDEGL